MKVILREDVQNLGIVGDTVEVKPGYARNFLIPRNLALPATSGNVAQIEHEKRSIALKRAAAIESAKSLAQKLADAYVEIKVNVGENGKMFGSVTTIDIAEAAAAKGIEVDRRNIHLAEPIRSIGEHKATVKLGAGVTGSLRILVIGEAPPAAAEDAAETAEATAN